MLMILAIAALCLASAVLGRLVLSKDEAWRTLTVRLPALLWFALAVAWGALCLALLGALCFIGGAFYGLGAWWLPIVRSAAESALNDLLAPVITGRR